MKIKESVFWSGAAVLGLFLIAVWGSIDFTSRGPLQGFWIAMMIAGAVFAYIIMRPFDDD